MNMQLHLAAAVFQDGSSDGLSGREVIESLPGDPASLFAFALVVGAMVAIIWFGRPGGGGTRAA